MNHHYNDIIERAGPPDWWDEHGCPRYGAYGPDKTGNIYADTVVFARIACQGCATEFVVAFSETQADLFMRRLQYERPDLPSLEELARDGTLHYGDPPNTGCCPAGPTMNSQMREVLELWRRNPQTFEWEELLGQAPTQQTKKRA